MRVLLVDDELCVRKAFARLLSLQSDIDLVGQATDGQQAIALTRALRPDVVLMDLHMPVMDGVEATRAIHAEAPQVRVLGLTVDVHGEHARGMLAAGAVGCVEKLRVRTALLAAIRACGRSAEQPACTPISNPNAA